MSDHTSEELTNADTKNRTRGLTGETLGEVNIAGSSQSTSLTSEEKARHFEAVIDPLTQQLKLPCDY